MVDIKSYLVSAIRQERIKVANTDEIKRLSHFLDYMFRWFKDRVRYNINKVNAKSCEVSIKIHKQPVIKETIKLPFDRESLTYRFTDILDEAIDRDNKLKSKIPNLRLDLIVDTINSNFGKDNVKIYVKYDKSQDTYHIKVKSKKTNKIIGDFELYSAFTEEGLQFCLDELTDSMKKTAKEEASAAREIDILLEKSESDLRRLLLSGELPGFKRFNSDYQVILTKGNGYNVIWDIRVETKAETIDLMFYLLLDSRLHLIDLTCSTKTHHKTDNNTVLNRFDLKGLENISSISFKSKVNSYELADSILQVALRVSE
jgi:hypothetical protein